VGERQKDFLDMTIGTAVYGTGWEGTVVIDADVAGTIHVIRPMAPSRDRGKIPTGDPRAHPQEETPARAP
jgi:hypothetical protein